MSVRSKPQHRIFTVRKAIIYTPNPHSIKEQTTHLGLFKSLWIILCECRYCIPLAICFDHVITLFGVTAFFWFFSRSYNGPYGQNSITMQKQGGRVHTPLNLTMLGWLSLRRFLMSVSLMSDTFFTATSSFFNLPENTAPWPPQPRNFRSVISSKEISQSSGRGFAYTPQIF